MSASNNGGKFLGIEAKSQRRKEKAEYTNAREMRSYRTCDYRFSPPIEIREKTVKARGNSNSQKNKPVPGSKKASPRSGMSAKTRPRPLREEPLRKRARGVPAFTPSLPLLGAFPAILLVAGKKKY